MTIQTSVPLRFEIAAEQRPGSEGRTPHADPAIEAALTSCGRSARLYQTRPGKQFHFQLWAADRTLAVLSNWEGPGRVAVFESTQAFFGLASMVGMRSHRGQTRDQGEIPSDVSVTDALAAVAAGGFGPDAVGSFFASSDGAISFGLLVSPIGSMFVETVSGVDPDHTTMTSDIPPLRVLSLLRQFLVVD